jgi:Holliday junction DNA helicase RuvA
VIAYVKGTVLSKDEHGCVLVTAGGVGYYVHMTTPLTAATAVDSEAVFHCSTIVREDALELYGFSSADERAVFEVLLTITRLGAKKALAILSQFSPDDLRRLVLNDDYTPLIKTPGIGKKSAQQIFLELKYKLEGVGAPPEKPAEGRDAAEVSASIYRDALAGLTNLGYDDVEAGRVLEDVLAKEPDLDVSAALRKALQQLGKNKA